MKKLRKWLKSFFIRVWVFDLDGILMDTGVLYRKSQELAFELIIESLGDRAMTLKEISSRQHLIDCKLAHCINPRTEKLYAYTKYRFPTSLVLTYEILCKEVGLKPKESVKKKLYKIGLSTFDKRKYPKLIKPHALSVFKFLHSRGDIIYVLTKGDKEIQGDKREVLKKIGFGKYWKGFRIAPNAKRGDFRFIAKKYIRKYKKATHLFSIGDTYEADIGPALKEGYFGIYIHSVGNWLEIGKLAKIELKRDKKRTRHYSNIIEVKEKYQTLIKLKGQR